MQVKILMATWGLYDKCLFHFSIRKTICMAQFITYHALASRGQWLLITGNKGTKDAIFSKIGLSIFLIYLQNG